MVTAEEIEALIKRADNGEATQKELSDAICEIGPILGDDSLEDGMHRDWGCRAKDLLGHYNAMVEERIINRDNPPGN